MPTITDEQLVAYVLNELGADARAQVERAMAEDDGVVARLAELDGLTMQVARATQDGDPDAHLRPEQREPLLQLFAGGYRHKGFRRNLHYVARVAAVLAVVGGAIYVASLLRQPRDAVTLGSNYNSVDMPHESAPEIAGEATDSNRVEERAAAEAVELFLNREAAETESLSYLGRHGTQQGQEAASAEQAQLGMRIARAARPGVTTNGTSNLQNVEVGGQIRIRQNYFSPVSGNLPGNGSFGSSGTGAGGLGGGAGGFGGGGADGIVAGRQYVETRDSWGVPIRLRRQDIPEQIDRERYATVPDSPFLSVADEPLSTFGLDVDTASFTNVRRMLQSGQRPPREAVRVEELINYLDYPYAEPEDGRPVALHLDAAVCPWQPDHRLVRVGVKAREVAASARPAANLVFLLDISGSMQAANKLPLLKNAMVMLSQQLRMDDNVAIVVYNSSAWVHLPPTSGLNKEAIVQSIGALNAGGSTNGAGGLELAYALAARNRVPEGINRVILATDGDFNTGTTDPAALQALVERERERGVFFTVLGFGTGNLNDSMLERIADHGNGQYLYVDSFDEIRRALVDNVVGTLHTVAKDVKIQVEFNPEHVGQYRLIGYENRALANADFRNDRKDAGDLGAGHTVTALYEIIPASIARTELRYQPESAALETPPRNAEWLTASLRYKEPDAAESHELAKHLVDAGPAFENADPGLRAAAAAAAFGMILRDSQYRGSATLDEVVTWARAAVETVPLCRDLVELAELAQMILGGALTQAPNADIRLIRVLDAGGSVKANIRTAGRTYWLEEGDAFESYELIDIDQNAGTAILLLKDSGQVLMLNVE